MASWRAFPPSWVHRQQPPLEQDERCPLLQPSGHGGEQWIKEGKNAVKWTRLSCHDFVDNHVRLQLFVLAYNLGNFFRQKALPKPVRHWTLTTLREKLIKICAKVVYHARYIIFQMAEVAVSQDLFDAILGRIRRLQFLEAG